MAYNSLPGFRYRPLDKAHQQIRLLEYSTNRSRTAQPAAKLRHVPLRDVRFVALSYTWGEGRDLIDVEDEDTPGILQKLSVSLNVIDALTNIRYQSMIHDVLWHIFGLYEYCLIWIDQICINQEDDVEKSWQVEMMASIYGRAEYLMIWLGPDAEDSRIAQDAISQLSNACNLWEQRSGDNMTESLSRDIDHPGYLIFLESVFEYLSANESEVLRALALFYNRCWFYRAWVIQEVVMADKAQMVSVVTGTGMLPWTDVTKGASLLFRVLLRLPGHLSLYNAQVQYLLNQLVRTLASVFLEIDERRNDRSRSLAFLLEIWLHLGIREASKPQDLVYSLLGMASDARTCGIQIDYSKPYQRVFAEAAVVLLGSAGADTLAWRSVPSHIDTTNPYIPSWLAKQVSTEVDHTLPSWVPEFRMTERRAKLVGSRHKLFKASNGHIFTFTVDDKLQILCLNVAFVDTVSNVSDINEKAMEYVVKLRDRMHNGVFFIPAWLQAFKELVQSLPTDHVRVSKRYSKQDIQEIVWRAPIGDRVSEHGETIRATPDIAALHDAAIEYQEPGPPEESVESTRPARKYESSLYILHKNMFVTDTGYIGVALQDVKEGDKVSIIQGAEVPIILRQIDDHFRNMGEAYVHGIMDGEFITHDHVFKEIEIR